MFVLPVEVTILLLSVQKNISSSKQFPKPFLTNSLKTNPFLQGGYWDFLSVCSGCRGSLLMGKPVVRCSCVRISLATRQHLTKFTASNTSADKNQLPNLKPKHQTVTWIRSACCFEFDLAPLSSSKHQWVKAYRSGFMILKDIRAVWDMQSKCLKITLGQERKIPGRAATFISMVVGNWKTQCLFLKSKLMRSWVACN